MPREDMIVKKQTSKFCIIIPMYNEAGNVLPTISRINRELAKNNLEADIICVDDGSNDTTAQELNEAVKVRRNVLIHTHSHNKGFGEARRRGMKIALAKEYAYALFMDADLTMDPKYIAEFDEKIMSGFDFVTGSRFISGGGMLGVPLYRRMISQAGNLVFRLCFKLGINDYSQGYRAIRMNIIERMSLKETGFTILVEELSQAMFLTNKFAEVPFVLASRQAGASKFSYSPRVIAKYIYYAAKALIVGNKRKLTCENVSS